MAKIDAETLQKILINIENNESKYDSFYSIDVYYNDISNTSRIFISDGSDDRSDVTAVLGSEVQIINSNEYKLKLIEGSLFAGTAVNMNDRALASYISLDRVIINLCTALGVSFSEDFFDNNRSIYNTLRGFFTDFFGSLKNKCLVGARAITSDGTTIYKTYIPKLIVQDVAIYLTSLGVGVTGGLYVPFTPNGYIYTDSNNNNHYYSLIDLYGSGGFLDRDELLARLSVQYLNRFNVNIKNVYNFLCDSFPEIDFNMGILVSYTFYSSPTKSLSLTLRNFDPSKMAFSGYLSGTSSTYFVSRFISIDTLDWIRFTCDAELDDSGNIINATTTKDIQKYNKGEEFNYYYWASNLPNKYLKTYSTTSDYSFSFLSNKHLFDYYGFQELLEFGKHHVLDVRHSLIVSYNNFDEVIYKNAVDGDLILINKEVDYRGKNNCIIIHDYNNFRLDSNNLHNRYSFLYYVSFANLNSNLYYQNFDDLNDKYRDYGHNTGIYYIEFDTEVIAKKYTRGASAGEFVEEEIRGTKFYGETDLGGMFGFINLGSVETFTPPEPIEGITVGSSFKNVKTPSEFVSKYSSWINSYPMSISNPYLIKNKPDGFYYVDWMPLSVSSKNAVDPTTAQDGAIIIDDVDDVGEIADGVESAEEDDDSDDDKTPETDGKNEPSDEGSTPDDVKSDELPQPLICGLIQQSLLNPAELTKFAGALIRPNFWTRVNMFLDNPMDAIISLQAGYVNADILVGVVENLNFNGYLFGSGDEIIQSVRLTKNFYNLDLGEVSVSKYFDNYLDITATKIGIYLPYVGCTDLDSANLYNRRIKLSAVFDTLTGSIVYFIRAVDDKTSKTLYTFNGNFLMQLPISATNNSQLVSALLAVGSTALTHVPTKVTMIGETTETLFGKMTPTENSTIPGKPVSAPEVGGAAGQFENVMGGSVTSSLVANIGVMCPRQPYIYIIREKGYNPSKLPSLLGVQSNIFSKLRNCSGFTVVSSVHLDGLSATESEINEIEMSLKGGVYV